MKFRKVGLFIMGSIHGLVLSNLVKIYFVLKYAYMSINLKCVLILSSNETFIPFKNFIFLVTEVKMKMKNIWTQTTG